VGSREEAQQQLEAAQQAAQGIYGLGPGGNKPLPPSGTQQWRQQQQQQEEVEQGLAEGGRGGPGPGFGGGRGRGPGGGPPPSGGGTTAGGWGGPGRGEGSGGRGRGGGRGPPTGGRGGESSEARDHRYKDQHKSAIANHHRKDRALKKAMGGYSG
jgi:activating signal cointegrator complex subunit 2